MGSHGRGFVGQDRGVKAGLGLAVLPKDMVPAGLHVTGGERLPDLQETEIALLGTQDMSRPAQRLKEHIVRSLER